VSEYATLGLRLRDQNILISADPGFGLPSGRA
jgi:hypothetical protein